ncbi:MULTISPECIES: hypothetical protein [unclassified Actinomyces]|uniref:hypothetical protein n=1 Tax=unclassified Actinomyces TaxID=2609248 RepID=UPI0011BD91D7|nr:MULTISPECIES: hypothetical protein [unclassified Actinomyces]
MSAATPPPQAGNAYVPGTPYGYIVAPPPPPKRRRRPLIIGAVSAVILLVCAGVGTFAVLRALHSSSQQIISSRWADGAHEVWTLDVEADSQVIANGNQLLTLDTGSSDDVSRLTAYDISGKTPTRSWSTDVGPQNNVFMYWGDVIIAGGQLLTTSGELISDVPWESPTPPVIVGTYAFTCAYGTCTGWSSANPTSELWQTRIEDYYNYVMAWTLGFVYVGEDATYALVNDDTAIDLASGETIDFDLEAGHLVLSLADGWITATDNEVTIFSPDGEPVDVFEITDPERLEDSLGPATELALSPLYQSPRPTAEQVKRFFTEGDLTGQQIQVEYDDSVSPYDDECPLIITVNEAEIVPAGADGSCDFTSSRFVLSNDQSVVAMTHSTPLRASSTLYLVGMWTVSDGSPIALGNSGAEHDTVMLINPSLIVTYDESPGRLTAYAPGS